ncbi:MAG TPA: HAD-IIIA family hydrolase, partial [Balneolaceae bacterium]|nr:HAD-IIIA family hydrolase [Balneolaceae bacterium]
EEWVWCDGALDALSWIQQQGFKIIVVTNQSGISKGIFSESDTRHLHAWADKKLSQHDITVDDWYYAPWHPEHDDGDKYNPEDRKPGTGMFEKAARKHDINFCRSFMAGDKITDLKPAIELGITPLFIRSRFAPSQDKEWLRRHNIPIFDTLWEGIQEMDELERE